MICSRSSVATTAIQPAHPTGTTRHRFVDEYDTRMRYFLGLFEQSSPHGEGTHTTNISTKSETRRWLKTAHRAITAPIAQ